MYTLAYYLKSIEVETYDLQTDSDVRTIGSTDSCHYIFRAEGIQPIHLMLRFVDDHFEVCPVGPCELDGKSLPINKWLALPYDCYCYLTAHSSIMLKGGENQEISFPVELDEEDDNPDSIYAAPPPPPSDLPINEHIPPTDNLDLGSLDQDTLIRVESQQQDEEDDEELDGILAKIERTTANKQRVPNELDNLKMTQRRKQASLQDSKSQEQPLPNLTGIVINDRYQVLKKIGSGAMGEVYQIYDDQLRRKVALKILVAGAPNKVASERFIREARAIGKLRHPNIVAVHDVGEYKNYPFFTMDLLDGPNVEEQVQSGPASPRKAMTWVLDIANALQFAHDNDIIHRDIKSSNIIITKQGAVLTDFGLARDMSMQSKLTTAGETLGTPAYMSPEQAQGNVKEVDHTSDVYSLGAVLYELLTGFPPFSGTTIEVLQKVCTIDPVSIHRFNKDVHNDAIIIVAKSLCKEKQYRYQTARKMATDIQCYLNGEPIEGKMPPFFLRFVRYFRYNKLLSSCVLVCLAILLSLVTWKSLKSYQLSRKKQQNIAANMELAQKRQKQLPAQHPPIDKLIEISELYTKVLVENPKHEAATKGKFDTLMNIAEEAIYLGNLAFAEALYAIANDIAERWYGTKEKRAIEKGKRHIQHLKVQRRERQWAKVRDICEELVEAQGQQTGIIRDTALSLLRFPKIITEVYQTYEDHENKRIREAIAQLRQYRSPHAQLDPVDSLLIQLLPYSNPSLNQKLISGLERSLPQIRAFCAKLLGISRCKAALPQLIKRVKIDNKKEVVREAIRALLFIEGGEELFMKTIAINFDNFSLAMQEQIEDRKKLLTQLGMGGQSATGLAIKILKKYRHNIRLAKKYPLVHQYFSKEEPQILANVFKDIGKVSIKPLLSSINTCAIKEKIIIVEALASFVDIRVVTFCVSTLKNTKAHQEPNSKHNTYRLAVLSTLRNIIEKFRFHGIKLNYQQRKKYKQLAQTLLNVLVATIKNDHFQIQKQALINLRILWQNNANIFSIKTIDQITPKIVGNLKSLYKKVVSRQSSGELSQLRRESVALLKLMGPMALSLLEKKLDGEQGKLRLMLLMVVVTLNPEKGASLLLPYLRSNDPTEVALAVEALKSVQNSISYFLMQQFPKRSPSVKRNILLVLDGITGDRALAFYKKAVEDPTFYVAYQAVLSLAKIGMDSFPKLLQLLMDNNPKVHGAAIEALSSMRDEFTQPLMGIFLNPHKVADKFRQNPEIVRHRIMQIFINNGESMIPAVLPLLEHKDINLRAKVIQILGKIGTEKEVPHIIKLLFAGGHVTSYAQQALEDMKKLAVPQLHQLYAKDDLSAAQRGKILIVLGGIREKKSIDLIIDALAKPELRLDAAKALEKVGVTIIPVLIQLLTDKQKREGAEKALFYMGKYALDELKRELLNRRQNLQVRMAIPRVLAKFRHRATIRFLLENTQDIEGHVASEIWKALRKMGGDVVVEIVHQWKTRRPYRQEPGILIANKYNCRRAVQPIMRLWRKSLLQRPPDKRTAGFLAREFRRLANFDSTARSHIVVSLLSTLRHRNPLVRAQSAIFLGKFRAKRAASALKRACRDRNPGVQKAAKAALNAVQ